MRSATDTTPGTSALQQSAFPDSRGCFVAGTGAPVVMLHASLGSKSQWTALAERLASHYRVIALDLCGYGDNDQPATPASFTLDDEVRLVADHLDRLVDVDARVHLVGHSYGGLVALRFAQLRRERIASLSLYEPVVFRMLNEEDETLAELMQVGERVAQLLSTGCRHDAARAFVDFWSGEGSYASMPLPLQASLARRVDKVPLDFRAASSWPHRSVDLHAIAAPTLLLAGNRSPAVVQRIHTLLALTLPNCRVGSFEAGHMGPITHAHRVNPWIEAFVDVCAERDTARASPLAHVPSGGVIPGRRDTTAAANSPSFDRV